MTEETVRNISTQTVYPTNAVSQIGESVADLHKKFEDYKMDVDNKLLLQKNNFDMEIKKVHDLINTSSAYVNNLRLKIETELSSQENKFLTFIKQINMSHILLFTNILSVLAIIYLLTYRM